jgi:hypothetical protein
MRGAPELLRPSHSSHGGTLYIGGNHMIVAPDCKRRRSYEVGLIYHLLRGQGAILRTPRARRIPPP